MSILRHVQSTIEQYQLLKCGDRIVIGVSGGPDSTALLHILWRLKAIYNLQLNVVHCNHQSRPEAAADQAFVEKTCQKLDIPFRAIPLTIKAKGEPGSWEDLARQKRFAAFIKTAHQTRADCIALGHHLDDCAETVLMRILRGTGLQGLQGILPRKIIQGIPIIRPLTKTTRRDILKFLQSQNISAREDETNYQTKFFRNKIRSDLLPFLEKEFQPQVKDSLARLAETIALDYDFMVGQAEASLRDIIQPKTAKAARLNLNYMSLKALHPALRQLLFRLAIAQLKGNTNRLTLAHSQKIESFINSAPGGAVLNLPGAIEIRKNKTNIFIRRNKSLKSRRKLL